MMRFLRGTFFRIGGILYQDIEDLDIQEAPPPIDLSRRVVFTAGMALQPTKMFTREYVPPPPRDLNLPSDTFDRAAGALGADWDYPLQSPAPNRPWIVAGQHVQQQTINVDCCAFWVSDVTWEVDQFRPESIIGQFSQIVLQDPLPHATGLNFVGVVLRCDKLAGTGVNARFYLGGVFWNGTGIDCRLYYWNGTAFTPLGTPNSILPWVPGDILRCEIVGDGTVGHACYFTIFKNTTMIMKVQVLGGALKTVTAGTSPGAPGIAIHGDGSATVPFIDNWSAGELRPPADTLFHRDNFNRPDGPLGQPWSFPFLAPNRPRINTHHAVAQGPDAYNVAFYSETGFNASDQYSQVSLTAPTAFPETIGVTLRTGGGVDAFYMGAIHGPHDYRIWLYWNDGVNPPTYTAVASGTGYLITNGILRCEVKGSVTPIFNMYWNGVLILTYTFTNTPIPQVRVGGFPGFAIFDPTGGAVLNVDNWEGGKL